MEPAKGVVQGQKLALKGATRKHKSTKISLVVCAVCASLSFTGA